MVLSFLICKMGIILNALELSSCLLDLRLSFNPRLGMRFHLLATCLSPCALRPSKCFGSGKIDGLEISIGGELLILSSILGIA